MRVLRPLLLGFLILTACNACAQMCPCEFGSKAGEKTLRHELGLNLFSLKEELIVFYSTTPVYNAGLPSGLSYKYHFDRFSLRFAGDYFETSYRYENNNPMNYNLNNGFQSNLDIRLGAEKTFMFKPVQVFMAADILLSAGKYSGITEGYGDMIWWGYRDYYSFTTRGIGISPAAGLRYRLSRRVSVSAETSLSILLYKSKKTQGPYGDEQSNALMFNPLRALSLNYHF